MPRAKPRKKKPASGRRSLRRLVLFGLLPISVVLALYTVYLDHIVTDKFEGKRWSIPSRVYARALELYPDKRITPEQLVAELKLSGYRASADGMSPGSYHRRGPRLTLATRRFSHWDGVEPARLLEISFDGGRISRLVDAINNTAVPLARLEPMQIGTLYPAHKEDRILVKLEELPGYLIDALIGVEDRHFMSHHGLDFTGIARALLANIRAGGVVQGGSTLTQQLVKNFYLSSERTLSRKFNEAIMALLLELHYDKREILQAYANEIYLGQDGARAIHGFGLAAEFYFNKPVSELSLPQATLLVAILRGPAYYDPRRHPERALKRRNQVIDTLARDGRIAPDQAQRAKQAPLGLSPKPAHGSGRYPAFIDLVKRQLRHDYREADLRSEGLRIFTTLDPRQQQLAEGALRRWLERLEKDYRMAPGLLQGGVVLSRAGSAEVTALVGGRDARYRGFNRALDIRRPVGSLLKPALYLNALEQGYTLASPIQDEPIDVPLEGGRLWRPDNYDHIHHGQVMLIDALAHSYNLAAVRLGTTLGIGSTIETLERLGFQRPLKPYPSLLLGAVEMAPIDIAQLYQTLADEGFHTPLRAVREVVDQQGRPLQRYPLETEQRFDPATVELIDHALEEALRRGTGQRAAADLPANIHLAGKTGTTDELRDSWFAGFSRDLVGVVWLGGDNNEVTGLTGASGALRVWIDIMKRLTPADQPRPMSADIEWLEIDPASGLRAGGGCAERRRVPFIRGTAPRDYAPCAGQPLRRSVGDLWEKLKGWFR